MIKLVIKATLTVCYYLVMYAFQSEFTLYSCLNVKELFARNRCNIWSLSYSNRIRAHNHLVCKGTLKRVRDIITAYSQMHWTDEYSQHSSIIWPIWLNGWVFVYKLHGGGLASRGSHLNFRYSAYSEQGIPWNPDKHRVKIHSKRICE